MEKNIKININFGFFWLLTIAFIVLKLIEKISWSWLWVLSPIWIPFCLLIIGWLITLLTQVITNWLEYRPYKGKFATGPKMIWDAKTKTMYSPSMEGTNETLD